MKFGYCKQSADMHDPCVWFAII